MRFSKYLMTAALVGVVSAGTACTQKAMDDTKKDAGSALDSTRAGADKAIDATKKAGEKTADVTKDAAQRTADTTKEVAGDVARKSKEVAATTGAVVTDSWITTKVKAKFSDETVLKGSDINVVTNDHVVTLKGTVPSSAAKTRAAAIASGTEHVTRVVNRLVVKER